MPLRSARRSAVLATGAALVLSVLISGPASADPTPSPTPSADPTPSASPSPAGPVATFLSLTRSAGTVTYGGVVSFTGGLARADGTPVANAPVQLLSRTAGQTSNVVLSTVRTGSDGRLTAQASPRTTAEYMFRFGGDAATAPSTSNKTVVNLRPTVTGAFAPAGIKLHQSSVLRGALAPAYAGVRLAIRSRNADGTWRDVTSVGIDGTGAYSWTVTPAAVGRFVYSVVLPAGPAHLQASTPAMAVQVDPRDLRKGDTGSDVLTLEQRLAAQKNDVGRIDGVFDYDLLHAVIAFQKSQGIARTGVYDAATRVRLGAPVAVRLRYPSAGRAIEIDLRKQVLYLSEGGVLRRVLDVSSGSGKLYEQDGVTHRATTPQGRFSILRKINDPNHESPLGILYRPAYFFQGWAIHGSSSVPTYPASHGCIRITDPAMDRLYDLLTIGTPVTVFTS
jgi:N-acetylmuramoyl-L-alanine amidase